MKVLLTGAAGFIGSNLAEALIMRGDDVLGYDSLNDFYDVSIKEANLRAIRARDEHGRFQFVRADIRDGEALDSAFLAFKPDVVVHLAAYAGVRPSLENPALYWDVNVMGTEMLLSRMVKHSVKRLVFASSSSVYGNNEKVPFSEDDAVDHPISPYAATKKACELMLHTYHHNLGMSCACLRFFTVYGRRQRPDLAIAKFAKLLSAGQAIDMYGDGETRRDYTYIDDIIDGVIKAIDFTGQGIVYEIFNLGESDTISLSEMIGALSRALGIEPKINRLPIPTGDVQKTYADISKAKRMLSYDPKVKFSEGIQKYIEYVRDSDERAL